MCMCGCFICFYRVYSSVVGAWASLEWKPKPQRAQVVCRVQQMFKTASPHVANATPPWTLSPDIANEPNCRNNSES